MQLRCELLSFFSIFGIQNNNYIFYVKYCFVVNCFHFSVSLGYKTTIPGTSKLTISLWIAFIFQYLWDTKQRLIIKLKSFSGCELLSFFSIFGIQNNFYVFITKSIFVVNCFHFSVSLGYKTTLLYLTNKPTQLWIAFIFQYLWDTKQLRIRSGYRTVCCELLSFFSIFGIQNNRYLKG